MKRMVTVTIALLMLLCIQCAPRSQAETSILRFTVPTFGVLDSTTCESSLQTVPVRSVSLWWSRSPADSLLSRVSRSFVGGALDSVSVSLPRGTYLLYVKAENYAGGPCRSNVVTVVFDGQPPAKITDLGR